jgi:hypothetical protein
VSDYICAYAQALCASPARLLGQELVLDKADEGRHGLSSEVDVAYCVGEAKILYPVSVRCESLLAGDDV